MGDISALGKIIAFAQPDEKQIHEWKKQGVIGIINLRSPQEANYWMDEEGVVKSEGLKYIDHPITVPTGISKENAEKLAEHIQCLRKGHDDPNTPIVVHCASSNRVGALLAIYAANGNSEDEAERMILAAGSYGLKDEKMIKNVRSVITTGKLPAE